MTHQLSSATTQSLPITSGKSQRDHYLFWQGSGNHIFERLYTWLDQKDHAKGLKRVGTSQRADCIQLAVYYSNFRVADYTQAKGELPPFASLLLPRGTKRDQFRLSQNELAGVRSFFESQIGSIFWLFTKKDIIALRCEDNAPFDVTDHAFWDENTPAKAKKFSFLKSVPRFAVPELFGTTDTAAGWGTITRLWRNAKRENVEIAEALLTSNQIAVPDPSAALRFLSPTQLETVIFKLFNDAGLIVTSCRGGTRSDIDLQVLAKSIDVSSVLPEFAGSEAPLIQVKRTVMPEAGAHDASKSITFNNKREAEGISQVRYFTDRQVYLVTLDEVLNRIPAIVANPYFIGTAKLGAILARQSSATTRYWLARVLGTTVFDIQFDLGHSVNTNQQALKVA